MRTGQQGAPSGQLSIRVLSAPSGARLWGVGVQGSAVSTGPGDMGPGDMGVRLQHSPACLVVSRGLGRPLPMKPTEQVGQSQHLPRVR